MLKKFINAAGFVAASTLSSVIKLSLVVGSKVLIFSCFLAIAPVAGTLFNLPTAILLTLTAILFKTGLKLYAITLGLPTIIATLCTFYKTQSGKFARIANFMLSVILPLACMTLFVWQQHAHGAFVYSFYWLIPPALYFLKSKNEIANLFVTSLSTVFVAHAVGSIMWLFTIPMSAEVWIALIPVVAIERLVLAFAMMGSVICFQSLTKGLFGFSDKRNSSQGIQRMFFCKSLSLPR
jgi:hypothetical protein